ncbi:MAG: TerB family tellurite resistance protein [Halapricum sp.]
MILIDVVVGVASLALTFGILSAVAVGYLAFYNYRTAVSALAGLGAGSIVGLLTGSGLVMLAGGVVGAGLGVAAARYHPRGGSLVTAGGFGLGIGVLSGLVFSPAVGLAAGLGLALGLAGLAWRFPRTALVPATGAVPLLAGIGVTIVLSTTLGGSSMDAFLGSAQSVGLVAMFPILLGVVSYVGQPYFVQYVGSVPPLWPERLRRLFGDEPFEGSREIRCEACGAIGDPGHRRCHACDSESAYEYESVVRTDVPSDAVAVNVPCPHCGERPIEEVTKAYRLTGLLLLYRWRTVRVLGCHACVASRLRRSALKTAITGWWSVTTFLVNPFLVVWNVGRSLYNRGPTDSLATALAEAGLPREWLTDLDDFDSNAHSEADLLVDALIQVGCRIMLADGQASPEEAETIRDAVLTAFPDYDAAEVEARIETATERDAPLEVVVEGLSSLLTLKGRQAVLALAAQVAVADGDLDADEKAQFQVLAEELDVDLDPVELAATGGVGEYVETTA